MRTIALHGLLQSALDLEGYLAAMTTAFVIHLLAPKVTAFQMPNVKVEGRAALGASLSNAMLGGIHWFIMLHRWKRLIEMVQELFPILILPRLTKTNGVIL